MTLQPTLYLPSNKEEVSVRAWSRLPVREKERKEINKVHKIEFYNLNIEVERS